MIFNKENPKKQNACCEAFASVVGDPPLMISPCFIFNVDRNILIFSKHFGRI